MAEHSHLIAIVVLTVVVPALAAAYEATAAAARLADGSPVCGRSQVIVATTTILR